MCFERTNNTIKDKTTGYKLLITDGKTYYSPYVGGSIKFKKWYKAKKITTYHKYKNIYTHSGLWPRFNKNIEDIGFSSFIYLEDAKSEKLTWSHYFDTRDKNIFYPVIVRVKNKKSLVGISINNYFSYLSQHQYIKEIIKT